jgi:hypothetical protein
MAATDPHVRARGHGGDPEPERNEVEDDEQDDDRDSRDKHDPDLHYVAPS